MRRKHKGSVVVSIGLFATLAYGQTVIISVTGARPLDQAAEQFEARYGIPVSYEDATYVYKGDLVDKTHPDYAKSHPDGPRALFPKGGTLVLRGDPNLPFYVAPGNAAMPLLKSLLDAHVKAGIPGEFKVIPNGDGLDIVPVAVKDVAGILSPDQSPLETKISLPELKRTGDETLNEICKAILASSGKKVGVGSSPFMGVQSIPPYSVTIGARNEPARSVLQRSLPILKYYDSRTMGHIPKMAWSLLYDPGQKIYALNVRYALFEVFR